MLVSRELDKAQASRELEARPEGSFTPAPSLHKSTHQSMSVSYLTLLGIAVMLLTAEMLSTTGPGQLQSGG